jgi:MoxR-like ATPase
MLRMAHDYSKSFYLTEKPGFPHRGIRSRRPNEMSRKPSKTATQILEGMSADAPAHASVVSPFGALTDLVRKNAEQVIDPTHCDEFVDVILSSGKEVIPAEEAGKALGVAELASLLMNPGFVRAGARRGFVFYIGADGGLHRYSVVGGPAIQPGALAVEGEADPGFYYELPWYADLKWHIDRGWPVLVIGPSGCGKSDAIERIFAQREQQLHIISCNARMTAEDFEGKIDLVAGETKFTPSVAAIAVRDGLGLHLEEADAADPQAWYSLYRALNGSDMRIVRAGLIIPRHKKFRAVATQNTEGRGGDEHGIYHGRSNQDESFLDRFENYVKAEYPTPDVEITILMKKTGISKKNAEKIVKTATELRKAFATNDVLVLTTVRRTIAAARNIAAGLQPIDAWRFALSNRAIEKDATAIGELVNRVYGYPVKKT